MVECFLSIAVMQRFDAVVHLAQHLPDGHRQHSQPQARNKKRRQVEQRPAFSNQPFVMSALHLTVEPGHRHHDHRRVLFDLADARLRKGVEQR
ncbi:hypothetical protein D3C81_795200 [compost metagenome]